VYAAEHFKQLNEWLLQECISTRYQFNILTPKDYGKFFTKLPDGDLIGFRSQLDVSIAKAGSAAD
jgi:hypothetical protein